MAKTNGIDLIIAHLTEHKDQTIAQIAAATSMTPNGVSANISQYNKGKPEGERILGMKQEGKASYVYWLESLGNRGNQVAKPLPEGNSKPPKVAAMAKMEPSLELSSFHLSQYIAGQMRAEFDLRLSAVLRPAIESGIEAMMSSIRTSLADAFRMPEMIASKVVDASMQKSVDFGMPIVLVDEPTKAPTEQQISEAVAKMVPPITMRHVPAEKSSPILNVVSTRTKHREKTKPEAAEKTAPVNEPPAKQKVVICSLLPVQQELIRQEYGDCFDLRLFYRDHEKALVKAVNHGDAVILMGDFISHRITHRIEAAGGKITVVAGGLTKLREQLTAMYCGEKAAA